MNIKHVQLYFNEIWQSFNLNYIIQINPRKRWRKILGLLYWKIILILKANILCIFTIKKTFLWTMSRIFFSIIWVLVYIFKHTTSSSFSNKNIVHMHSVIEEMFCLCTHPEKVPYTSEANWRFFWIRPEKNICSLTSCIS